MGRMPGATDRVLRRVIGLRGDAVPLRRLRERVGGRTVVVTGASRGVGASVARVLGLAGAHVVLVARDADALARVADDVALRGGTASVLPLDLRDLDAAAAAGHDLAALRPVVLVSNAGHSIRRSLADSVDRAHDAQRLVGVHLLGPIALALPVLAAMGEAGGGHLVSVGSASSGVPTPGWAAYGSSKAAMEAWLRSAAPELRRSRVAVTSVRLPLVRTAMSAPTYGATPRLALSADEAASIVCAAIVDRPRVAAPWWVRPADMLATAAPTASERLAERLAGLRRER